MNAVLAIVVGAALGAPLRYAVERRLAGAFPYGTLLVNVIGSAILGALLGVLSTRGGSTAAPTLVALVGVGFCGSLTTFGGYAAQVLDLAVARDRPGRVGSTWRSLGYACVSVLACVAVAALAYVTGRLI